VFLLEKQEWIWQLIASHVSPSQSTTIAISLASGATVTLAVTFSVFGFFELVLLV